MQLHLSGVDALGFGAQGAWAGQDGRLARWDGTAWVFVPAAAGRMASTPSGRVRIFDGALWRLADTDLQNLDGVRIGAALDAVNRLAVAAEATLLSHAEAGHQLKINKAAATDTASLLFQSGWSGRAEIGLAGGDDWSIKVSPDGAAWTEALRVDAATAKVTLGTALHLTPGSAPASAAAGDLYFDAATSKLRCHDGTVWHDLF
ncbi:DUF2793 domain-containing protein [Aestuariicoccus sp. MJ-SS9]|uniref:DUF2793 domain-containing protein n=1 Tax=Aestuariicoccus sp. MJ-SS9 TaxID=3079855 RepID=UPI0029063F96|nr:DUF2793 domain-containing protein [Aestuariicoccus sp. MJ-SS9]MDU8912136.1 DUF2793 domain-containing protein [Aestuariicoccus sp. MJ-SS9]